MSTIQLLRPVIRRILHPHGGRILWLCILTVLQSLLQVAMALLSRFVIDAALSGGKDLRLWGALLIADILSIVLIHSLLSWYSSSTADRLGASMRRDILRTAVFSRDEQLLGFHSGELLNRGMEDVRTICDSTVNALPGVVGQVARLVAAFAAVLMISPMVAAALLVASVLGGGVVACLRPMLKKQHRIVRRSDAQMMSAMQEDLQHIELIQSLNAQEQTLNRFGKQVRHNLQVRFKRRLFSVGSSSVIGAASQLASGALLLWGATQIATGALSYGSLTAMIQLFAQIRSPIVGLSGLWSRLAAVEVAAERLSPLLNQPALVEIVQQQKITAIVFENVTFRYPGEEIPVLKDFNFYLPLDNWTCLGGVSGRGKTTMFKLILGLYTPQNGRIYLESPDGQLPCTEATRSLFAYVPQDYALFSGTVLENMQLVAPDLTDAQLHDALAIAQADFVWNTTEGENTHVQENNAGLSKGQLQRLAIARAVLMDRPVFLLDECTSALDAATEAAVLKNLKALGKQAVLVTHRPAAVEELGEVTFASMEQ